MNKIVTAAEANRNLSKLLNEARLGHEITVTSHGTAIARIVPPAKVDLAERERAKQRLLERLRSQPALNLGPWSRAEAYDDDL